MADQSTFAAVANRAPIAMFTLRRDVQGREGNAFSLRDFHERVMRNGIAPWWAHRFLILGDSSGQVIERPQ